jgi:dephospho-CoA kinase
MKVIGAVGRSGSGKDTLVNYLGAKCGIPTFSTGDIIRKIAEIEDLPQTRETLQQLSQQYMEEYGSDYFIRRLIREIEGIYEDTVGITGIRRPEEIDALRKRFSNVLIVHVAVDTPLRRFSRLQDRSEPRDPEHYEVFLKQEQEEEQLFHISETVERADISIDNSGTVEEFHRKIDASLVPWVFDGNNQDLQGTADSHTS